MGKMRWALEPLLVTIPKVQFPCDANRKNLFLHFPGLNLAYFIPVYTVVPLQDLSIAFKRQCCLLFKSENIQQ